MSSSNTSPHDYSRKHKREILEPWRQCHNPPPSPPFPLLNRTSPPLSPSNSLPISPPNSLILDTTSLLPSPNSSNPTSSYLPPQISTQNHRINTRPEEVDASATTMGCSIFTTPFVYLGVKLDIIREVTVLRTKGINLLDLIRKKVGNGLNTLIWEDPQLVDLALKHKFPRLYALENYKQITVVEKINHASMVDTFRRHPRGGAEEEQLAFFYPAWMLIDDLFFQMRKSPQVLKKIPNATKKRRAGKGCFFQEVYVMQHLPVRSNCLSTLDVSYGISIISLVSSWMLPKLLLMYHYGDGIARPLLPSEHTSTIPTSAVRNIGGRSGPQGLEEPTSDEVLREPCDKNYRQLLPLIAEKMQKEKEQQDKLNAVKARLLYDDESGRNPRNREESHYSESKMPTSLTELRRKHGSKHSRSPSPIASVVGSR
ncbi:hypothetical protein Tco_0167333 [Tanacetum coccineum]